jgi:N-acetylglucosamine kinase-like BadF-type ATPase
MGRHPDGRVERFLGIGPWSGDWGGGRGIVLTAVAAAVRAADGRGPATALADRLVHVFGMPVDEVAFAAHHDRIAQADLLSFSPVVFDTAHAGDEVARQIVTRMGDEVVSFAAALLRRMQLTDGDPDVVLGGSVLQAEDTIVMDRVRAGLAEVAPNARIRVLDVAPVAGALVAALELAGSTADQTATARQELRRIPSRTLTT